jgi:hypothetical protein
MATNPTNSTSVSLLNLPQAQLATSTDYLILQTTNGTQIIPFGSFNVVRADINGNATVVGDLTGNNAVFIGGINTVTLTASQYFTTGGQKGWTDTAPIKLNSNNYYDSFTITNGLIVSATPTSLDYTGNPMYTSLFTQLTAASASLATMNKSLTANKNIYDFTATVNVSQSASNANQYWQDSNFYSIVPTSVTLNSAMFTIAPATTLTAPLSNLPGIPYISNIVTSTNTFTYTLNLGTPIPGATLAGTNFNVRLLVTY